MNAPGSRQRRVRLTFAAALSAMVQAVAARRRTRRGAVAAVSVLFLINVGTAGAVVQAGSIDNSAAFPDKVISLIYDDGPDVNSLTLARYLRDQKVSATFNVVGNWGSLDTTGYTVDGYETHLSEVVRLGHRLSNHTYNHAILTNLDADEIRFQLNEADRYISQFVATKFFSFTAPGSNWNQRTADAVLADSSLNKLSGSYNQWYVPGVATSCHFRLPAPSTECMSPNGNDTEYRAAGYTPQQFVDDLLGALDAQPHPRGNIFMHDRNQAGVGGTFALNASQLLIPALKQRGYVFAGLRAKVSTPTAFERFPEPVWASAAAYDGTFRTGDVNGDGLVDVCARGPAGIYCSRASVIPSAGLDDTPDITFGPAQLWEGVEFTNANGWTDYPHAATIMLADVNGDAKADIVAKNSSGLIVGLSNGSSFGQPSIWSHLKSDGRYDFSDADGWASHASYYRTFRAGDINGDGKVDVCARGSGGIRCATSTGASFNPAVDLITNEFTNALGWSDARYASTLMLADVTGDGRADVIAKGGAGLVVARAASVGSGFSATTLWSAPVGTQYDFGDSEGFWQTSESYWGTFRAGDLTGDGRADVCARTSDGVRCALSAGNAFRRSSDWDDQFTNQNGWLSVDAARTLVLGDAGGDGRADILGRNSTGLIGAFAP
jgi:peptidoglycan/xylan/chitin deacetylase (PgdA/CDA1 family)